jgi:hypothetical protein
MEYWKTLRINIRKRTFLLSFLFTGFIWIALPKSLLLQDTKGVYPVICTMLCILNGIVLPMVMAKFTISQSESRKVAKGEFLEVSQIITHIEHTFSRLFMCLFVSLYLFLCTQLQLGKDMLVFETFQEINLKVFLLFIFLLTYSLLMLYQTAPLVIIYARKYINERHKEHQVKVTGRN